MPGENNMETASDIKEIETEIIKTVVDAFPNTTSIVLWGSATYSNFSPKLGDIDMLVILDKILDQPVDTIREKLYRLSEGFREKGVELDPGLTTVADIKNPNFQVIKVAEPHKAHSLVHYQIKYLGKVIYGNKDILNTIPEISLSQAIADISPHVKENFIVKIREELEKAENMRDFIKDKKAAFYVLARTIFTLDKQEIATKPEACIYLASKYPQFKDLALFLKGLYEKRDEDIGVSNEEVGSFLEFVDNKIKG